MPTRRKLSVGDWVEVRSKEEVLRTLDQDGRLDGMPFMPEMFEFCGKKFQVFKRAHKTCDPDFRSRRIENAVHLETRCDGSAHGGCQAGCLLYWKDEWLTRISGNTPGETGSRGKPGSELISVGSAAGCTESVVRDRVQAPDADGGGFSYVCQITQVQYQAPLPWWDLRQYIEDYTSGNITLRRLLSGTIYSMYYHVNRVPGLGPATRWFYNFARPLWRGSLWPRTTGVIPEGQPTPDATLDLQPGELVRVKPHQEILQTVTTSNKNRGLWWDAELLPYCGGTFKVLKRVTNIIDERTGKMQVMKKPSIILDSVVCQSRYTKCRMFCPKNTYAYWREIWLERELDPESPDRGRPSPMASQSGVAGPERSD
jgi:hypothetical protein